MWRKFVYNNHLLIFRRKQLRNGSTSSENDLWQYIKSSKLGYKFVRQYSLEGYVMDFYCPKCRLCLEIDGEIHDNPDQIKYDVYRDRFIKSYDITVLHIKNIEISQNINEVIKKIKTALPS